MLTFSGWIRRNTFWDLIYLLIFTSLWSWVITAFFYQLSNVSFMRATFSLFFHNRMCLNRTVFTIYIFDLNMHWFKPDCVSRDWQTLQYHLCKNWLLFVRQHALAHLHCYLLITDGLQSGNYHYKCDFASEGKKTASLSNEHKMSYKKLITMNYWQRFPHFTIKCTWVLLGVSSFLRAHSFAKESFANIWIIQCWFHHNMLTLLQCWICINTRNIVMNRTADCI